MPSKTIVVTGASSGFGAMTVRALADAGHVVFAGMRDLDGRNKPAAHDTVAYARAHSVELRPIELDVSTQDSVDTAVASIINEVERLDVVVHNAGHMVLGPTEAFTPEQIMSVYDTNVISTQRLNRAALPHLRAQRDGLLVWVSSTSTRGGTPPYLGPYFAAKAAEDTETAASYEALYAGLLDQVAKKLADLAPPDADPVEVARAIVRVVDTPKGQRPFRVHIDPADDGAETVNRVGDLVRREFYRRIDLDDLLGPATSVSPPATTAST
jgi:short-subunit dehydrogenase involved in D-alanine esterification of teichoic acids